MLPKCPGLRYNLARFSPTCYRTGRRRQLWLHRRVTPRVPDPEEPLPPQLCMSYALSLLGGVNRFAHCIRLQMLRPRTFESVIRSGESSRLLGEGQLLCCGICGNAALGGGEVLARRLQSLGFSVALCPNEASSSTSDLSEGPKHDSFKEKVQQVLEQAGWKLATRRVSTLACSLPRTGLGQVQPQITSYC